VSTMSFEWPSAKVIDAVAIAAADVTARKVRRNIMFLLVFQLAQLCAG
jgi:hypothetical protein